LLDTVQRIRAVAAGAATDPQNIYFGRPDLAAAAEATAQAALLRAGVRDPGPATPEQIAARQSAPRFASMPEGLRATIAERAAAVVERSNVDQEAKTLRERLGPEYDVLLDLAKAAGALPAGATADEHSLRILAAQGKYAKAYQQTKPGARR
jgi:hypothetical protein